MFNKAPAIALLASSLAFAVSANAGSTGLYVGGSVGQTTVEASQRVSNGVGGTQNLDFEEDGDSYKLFVGYMFLPFVGVEGGYTSFGNPNKNFSNNTVGNANIDVEIDGWEAFVIGVLPLGPVDLFAKAGGVAYNIDTEVRVNGTGLGSGSDSDETGAYGVGAAFAVGAVKIRAEYTAYDVSGVDDLYMVSAGVTYHF